MRFKALQPDNPILRAEIAYQRRAIPRGLQWFDRFGVVAVALVVSLYLLYFPAANTLYGKNWSPNTDTLPTLLATSWIAQIVVILRFLFAGFNAMRHHHGQQSQDVLALTGISIRQLFTGKWWSVLVQLRGWLLAFGIIKLAIFAILTLNLVVYCYRSPLERAIGMIAYYGGNTALGESALAEITDNLVLLPSLNRIVITGALIVLITLLEVFASSAVGIVGGVIPEKTLGLIAALLLRFASVVGFTLLPDYPNAGGVLLWRWYEHTWFSLADGGSTAILRAGLPYHGYIDNAGNINGVLWAVLLAFYAAIAMYLAYLLFSLTISYILLRRQGFLPASPK